MSMPYLALLIVVAALLIACGAQAEEAKPITIRFAKGAWDPAKWTPARQINQAAPFTLSQLDGAIGTTAATFTREDYNAERDNAILLYDLGTTEAQVDVTFTIGKGFGGTSSPGLCIAPQVENGLVKSCIGVFVADYTMALWRYDIDADGKTLRIAHLAQFGRWTDVTKPHVLRVRMSKKEQSLAFQLDDSDVLVFTYVGHKTYGSIPLEINSLVGLWGCHGEGTFKDMTISTPGTLPFLMRSAPKK